ncbi:MAG: ankyrin repeat domain-containing protein, partial [Treponema sp.]|nr:ankyrin repeat domain-containing protein [Treponema sp.]
AAKSGNDWDVANLLERGADVQLRDSDGWTALMYAVRYQSNMSIVRKLLDAGAYTRVRNKHNATPLLMAADYTQNPQILSALLENRSFNDEEVFKAFILCITSSFGSDHIKEAKIKLFVEGGIPVNMVWKGKTPLMYACEYTNSLEVIRMLIEHGADISAKDENGKSALDYALSNQKLDSAKARKLLSK